MNIDKVNSALSKAIIHIQQAENEDLRAMDEGAGDDDGFVAEYVDGLVSAVTEAAEVNHDRAVKVVIEAMEALSAKHPVKVKTGADVAAWATKVGLADEIQRRLA